MPVYFVTAVEAVGGERPFEYEQDAPLTIGNYVRDSQTTYIVTRILPDESGPRLDDVATFDLINEVRRCGGDIVSRRRRFLSSLTGLVSSFRRTSLDLIGKLGESSGGMLSRRRHAVGSLAGLVRSRRTPFGS